MMFETPYQEHLASTLANEITFEIGNAKLNLASSLSFSLNQSSSGTWYQVRNESTGDFFRLGLPEYSILSMCDGERTVNQIALATSTLLGKDAPSENEIISFCQWAIESGLVYSDASIANARLAKKIEHQTQQQALDWLNPISIRVPFCRPDNALTKINSWTSGVFSAAGLVVWLLVCAAALAQLVLNWNDFHIFGFASYSAVDFVWFGLTWFLLKLVHELAHGLACKKFGGSVRSCGAMFLLFIPLPYVDVTSSWSFPDKYQRILVSAAGMMVELFLAAIAVFIWFQADPGPLKFHMGNLIISASLTTLLFNLNPLMKFDGYFILADWLEIPNLQSRGRQSVQSWGRRWCLGITNSPPREKSSLFIKTYGWLSFGWTWFVVASLSLAAVNLFDGFGLLLATAGLLVWLGRPAFKFLKFIVFGSDGTPPNRGYILKFATVVGGIAILAFNLLPSPTLVRAPLVIDYDPLTIVRTETSAFVRDVLISDCDSVETGQVLLILENPELEAEFAEVEVRLQQEKLKAKMMQREGQVARWQAQQTLIDSLSERAGKLSQLLEQLTVVAPAAGRIVTPNIRALQGTYVSPGEELLAIGEPYRKKAVAIVRQQDADWLTQHTPQNGRFIVWGQTHLEVGRKIEIEPTASTVLPHPALAAINGGSVSVVDSDESPNTQKSRKEWNATTPYVMFEFQLDESQSHRYQVGQTGELQISARDESLGKYLTDQLCRWLGTRLQRNHGL